MLKRLVISACIGAGLVSLVPVVEVVSAMPVLPAIHSLPSSVERVRDRHHHARRHDLQQRSAPRDDGQEPTGGGDYGGPASAFPVGENAATRPGGSQAITAPIGSAARTIQKNRQDEFCRYTPERC